MVITRSGLTIEMRHASVIDGHEIVETYIEDGQPLTVKETPRVEIETKAVITSRWELSKDGSTPKSEVSTYWYSHNYVYDKQYRHVERFWCFKVPIHDLIGRVPGDPNVRLGYGFRVFLWRGQ